MPRGKHMKGRTNNPAGRPQSPYVPPTSKSNDLGVWQLPKAERLLYDLRKEGGNLDRLIKRICKNPEHEESLLVAILEELEAPGNEMFFDAWKDLIHKNERARLVLLEQSLLRKLEDGDEDKQKLGTSELSALKFLFQTRLPERYKPPAKGAEKTGNKSGTATPEQQALADKLAALAGEGAANVGK